MILNKIMLSSFLFISLYSNEVINNNIKNSNDDYFFDYNSTNKNFNDINLSINNKKEIKKESYDHKISDEFSLLSKEDTKKLINEFNTITKKRLNNKYIYKKMLDEAKKSNYLVQYYLAIYYKNNKILDEAIFWFEKSSNNISQSLLELSFIYEDKDNNSNFDDSKFLNEKDKFYMKAIENYEKYSFINSKRYKEMMFNIGLLMYKHHSYDEKYKFAIIDYFEKSIKENDGSSEYYIGMVYLHTGYKHKSEEWLIKSANKNEEYAQSKLGKLYMKGDDYFLKNYEESSKWLIKSMYKGNVESMYNLSIIYYEGGYGLTKNIKLSLKLLNESSKQGYYKSLKRKEKVNKIEKSYEYELKRKERLKEKGKLTDKSIFNIRKEEKYTEKEEKQIKLITIYLDKFKVKIIKNKIKEKNNDEVYKLRKRNLEIRLKYTKEKLEKEKLEKEKLEKN